MAATPNLNEIKEACGSNDLADCYKFLFSHNKADDLGFLARMGQERDQLVAIMEKREQDMNESDSFGPFHEVATDVHDCLFEMQMADRSKLELLTELLVVSREAAQAKDGFIDKMTYEEGENDG